MDYVINRGTANTEGMIIGEAPGAEEEREGKPFVGRAGRLLEAAFNELGDSTDSYYVTNVYKLRPPDNRTPTQSEIDSHLPALRYEISVIEPKAILALGATAMQTLSGFIGITKHRGSRLGLKHDLEWGDIMHDTIVVPTFHPAYLLRNPRPYERFLDDIREFIDAVHNA